MRLVLAALLCAGSGFALASLTTSRILAFASRQLVRASISMGYGLGIFSVAFLLCRISSVTNLIAVDCAVFVMLLGAALLFRDRPNPAVTCKPTPTLAAPWLHRMILSAFSVALGVAVYSAVERLRAHPYGDGWDAFAIWNLHARFLFLGGSHWRDGFSPLIPWSHADYPLLLPGAIAHFWDYLGHDDPIVPAIIGMLFAFSTVGLLFSALSILRGQTTAMLGALSLVTTPFFIEQASSQYADVPLSFFVLATVALLCLQDDQSANPSGSRRLLAGAGIAAAFAGWTKNEGLLFVCAILSARFLMLLRLTIPRESSPHELGRRPECWKAFATLLASAVPVLVLVAWFKHSVAPPSDLFSNPSTSFQKLLDLTRCWAILRWFVKGFFRFGSWLLIPGTVALFGLYVTVGRDGNRKPTFAARSSVLALALTLTGYFVVYLITPYDIYWHLRFSLTRLFLQLWPGAIFLFFLAVPLGRNQAG